MEAKQIQKLAVLAILAYFVLPFAFNRPVDLLKLWLGVLTVVQLLQVYAFMQMHSNSKPAEAFECMGKTNTDYECETAQKVHDQDNLIPDGLEMGKVSAGALINEKVTTDTVR